MVELRQAPGRAPPERRFARMLAACAASAGVHAAVLAGLTLAGPFRLEPHRAIAVALRPLPAAEWEANRGLSGAEARPRPPEPKEVVALPPDLEKDPERELREPRGDVRYLAARDEAVERETVSRHAGAAARLLRVPQRRIRARAGSGERGSHLVAIPGREGPAGGGGTDPDAAAPRPPPDDRAAPPHQAPPAALPVAAAGLPPADSPLPADGEGGARIDAPRVSGMPLHEHAQPEGGPNLDGVGLEEGAETRLHTRRFEPAEYWTDFRARVEDDWQRRALVLVKEWDPHEDTYFYKPRTVRVAITLDARGALTDVRVLESSLLDFYDEIAIAAVRERQPYPPPPPGAIRSDGSARINMAFTWLPSDGSKRLR
jgi:TonB family protein